MIPRFIIRKPKSSTLDKLLDLGYEPGDNPLTENVLILGKHIMNAPETIDSPLLKIFNGDQEKEILELAVLQAKWQATAQKTELLLGDPAKGKVIVSKLGVMIDSCLIPITLFHQIEQQLLALKSPFIVSHTPIINRKRPFLTVGCADYSLDDLSKILTAYYGLS